MTTYLITVTHPDWLILFDRVHPQTKSCEVMF